MVGTLGNSIFLVENGQTLHVSDGTPAGTRLLDDLLSTEGAGLGAGQSLFAPVFHRSAPLHVGGLWTFDEAGNGQPSRPATCRGATARRPSPWPAG